MTDSNESLYVEGYPAPTPLMERMEQIANKTRGQIASLEKRLATISRGAFSAEVLNLVPHAVTLRWEKTTPPAYHTGEYATPDLYLDALLDAEGKEIDLSGSDIYDWISESLTNSQDDFGINLWTLDDGDTGIINLLDAVSQAEAEAGHL